MDVRFRPRALTLALVLALTIKASSALAQEDSYGAYRHEFYREDDNRMSIDTDSASFDIPLKPLTSPGLIPDWIADHMRLTGEFVYDGISGATPTGAPPMSQWTLANNYKYWYNTELANATSDPNNLLLYQSGLFSSAQAYTNYVAQNTPQLGPQATNDLKNFNQTLSTNALYRSGKVPLTQMHDIRRAYSGSIPVSFDNQVFTPSLSISRESDYHSYGMAFAYQAYLNQKNTTLNLGWSHNVDRVRDWTEKIWQGKVSDNILIGVNQLITPKSYLTLDLTYGQEYGYLDDPYRVVLFENMVQANPSATDASTDHENRPRRRTYEIVYGSYTRFVTQAEASAVVGYRFFHDSYGIYAQTLETSWNQKLGKRVVLSPGFRYYYQTAANFYGVIFPDSDNPPANYSSDYRLSRMQTLALSLDMSFRVQKHFSIDLTYMRYIMQGLDGVTSQSAYPSANVGSVGARVWF